MWLGASSWVPMSAALYESFFPSVEHGVGRVVTKGEDFHCENVGLGCGQKPRSSEGQAEKRELTGNGEEEEEKKKEEREELGPRASFSLFGVFDGHGGKDCARFCSESLLRYVSDAQKLDKDGEGGGGGAEAGAGDEGNTLASSSATIDLSEGCGLTEAQLLVAREQERFVDTLPQALVQAFKGVDALWKEEERPSGTTATVAFLSGWELVVASVGDSCAYFHTGTQMLQVSGNHRIEEDPKTGKVVQSAEVERVKKLGGSIARAEVEGKAVGPLRIWPGGLAMTRTIGDVGAEEVSSSEPEVRHLSLPQQGGRLIIASDGLWDAITPKQAFSLIKTTPNQTKAAGKLCRASVKALGKRDDITVLVADINPPENTIRRDEALVPTPKQHFVRFPIQKAYDKWKTWNRYAWREICTYVNNMHLRRQEQEAEAKARALLEEEEKAKLEEQLATHGGVGGEGNSDDEDGWESPRPKRRNSNLKDKSKPTKDDRGGGGGGGGGDDDALKQKQEALERKKLKRKLKKLEKKRLKEQDQKHKSEERGQNGRVEVQQQQPLNTSESLPPPETGQLARGNGDRKRANRNSPRRQNRHQKLQDEGPNGKYEPSEDRRGHNRHSGNSRQHTNNPKSPTKNEKKKRAPYSSNGRSQQEPGGGGPHPKITSSGGSGGVVTISIERPRRNYKAPRKQQPNSPMHTNASFSSPANSKTPQQDSRIWSLSELESQLMSHIERNGGGAPPMKDGHYQHQPPPSPGRTFQRRQPYNNHRNRYNKGNRAVDEREGGKRRGPHFRPHPQQHQQQQQDC